MGPTGYVMVQRVDDKGQPDSGPIDARIEAALRSTLPVTDIRVFGRPDCPAAEQQTHVCGLDIAQVPALACPYASALYVNMLTGDQARAAWADPRCANGPLGGYGLVVDDGSGLAALTGATGDDLRQAQATLQHGGVVVREARFISDGMVTVNVTHHDNSAGQTVAGPPAPDATLRVPGHLLTTGIGRGLAIVAPDLVTQAGLVTRPSTLVVVTSRMPNQSEQDKMHAQLQALGNDSAYVEPGPLIQTDVRIIVLLVAAAAITLAAAGVATALTAADGRQDLSTLAAVGASPRVRRGLSLSQSGVIAGLGSVLGALAGTAAAIAIIEVLNQGYRATWPGPTPMPIALPWLNLAVALLVVPGLAMLGAGTLTRSRLPIERRL
jgi:putative ABC transport system permease protein